MQALSFEIKPVEITEVNQLRDICIKTFSETYQHLNTPENYAKYIESNFNHHQLSDELKNFNSFTYFIYSNTEIIGYLKLNIDGAQTEDLGSEGLEVERIYVAKKYHGHKAGRQLIKKAIEKAKELHKKFVWLGVWEKNERAMVFYEKNDFIKFDEHVFKLGDDAQTDHLYKFTL